MKLTASHWLAIVLVAAGLGTQIATLPSWVDATTPSFVGGTLVILAGVARGIFSDYPSDSAR
jgi:hypothetical protein